MKKISKDQKLMTFLREKEAIIIFSSHEDFIAFRELQESLGIPPPVETSRQTVCIERIHKGLKLLDAAEKILHKVHP